MLTFRDDLCVLIGRYLTTINATQHPRKANI